MESLAKTHSVVKNYDAIKLPIIRIKKYLCAELFCCNVHVELPAQRTGDLSSSP